MASARIEVSAAFPATDTPSAARPRCVVQVRAKDGRIWTMTNYKGRPWTDEATAYKIAEQVVRLGTIDPDLWMVEKAAA